MLEMTLVVFGVLLFADVDIIVTHRKKGALQMVYRLEGIEVGELFYEINVPVGQVLPVFSGNNYRRIDDWAPVEGQYLHLSVFLHILLKGSLTTRVSMKMREQMATSLASFILLNILAMNSSMVFSSGSTSNFSSFTREESLNFKTDWVIAWDCCLLVWLLLAPKKNVLPFC